jgi:hypothetical protein
MKTNHLHQTLKKGKIVSKDIIYRLSCVKQCLNFIHYNTRKLVDASVNIRPQDISIQQRILYKHQRSLSNVLYKALYSYFFHIETYLLSTDSIYKSLFSTMVGPVFMSRQVTDKQVDVAEVSTVSFKVSTSHVVRLL